MSTQMTVEEYKQKVKDCLMKKYQHITEEERQKEVEAYLTRNDALWEQYMQDFSPEVCAAALPTGLI